MVRTFYHHQAFKCLFLIVLMGSKKGLFSVTSTEENVESQPTNVSKILNTNENNFGIHASFMISPYPTSSLLDIPHGIQARPKRFPRVNRKTAGKGRKIVPHFEDANGTTVIGSPGGSITISCNIFMLQDYTVSWVHRTAVDDNIEQPNERNDGEYRLDLLTIGNSTYTSDERISSHFRHPSDWGLKIDNLKPSDAGVYLCQLSTFPEKVRFVFLEIQGSMIEIIRDQVVYNSGSNLEVACIYRNSTGVSTSSNFGSSESFPKDDIQRRRQEAVLRMIENARRTAKEQDIANKVPINTIIWLHNGSIFSLRNRRRVKTSRKYNDEIHSTLSIKSAILSDSGNYSCVLGPLSSTLATKKSPINQTDLTTNYVSDTVRLVVVNGEHSAAIYNKEGTVAIEAELDLHQNLQASGDIDIRSANQYLIARSILVLYSLKTYLHSTVV